MSARQSVSTLRVRYAETDQMGVAWHGNFFAWFEVGRTDLLRALGFTYRELEQQGVRLPVIESHARYFQPARYDDLLEVRTTLLELGRARMSFRYDVFRAGSSDCLATGGTSHATVNPEGRPCRMPQVLLRLLA